jgi:hypothetical protein
MQTHSGTSSFLAIHHRQGNCCFDLQLYNIAKHTTSRKLDCRTGQFTCHIVLSHFSNVSFGSRAKREVDHVISWYETAAMLAFS